MSLEHLTIVIPTFNRIELLRRSLKILLPILPEQVKLVILDNCSDDVVENKISDINSKYPTKNLKVYRNEVNIGGNCNIMRALEYCETKYLWILGDDDIVQPDSFQIISETLKKYWGSIYLNFSTSGGWIRDNVICTQGLSDFVINGIDDLGQIMFISSSIFDAEKLKKLLPLECSIIIAHYHTW